MGGFAVRATPKRGVREYCPITAVVFQETRTYFHPDDYKIAAKLIGLKAETAEDIMDAADDNHEKDRQTVMKAAGLTM